METVYATLTGLPGHRLFMLLKLKPDDAKKIFFPTKLNVCCLEFGHIWLIHMWTVESLVLFMKVHPTQLKVSQISFLPASVAPAPPLELH